MIEILPQTEDQKLAVRISGKLTQEDYDKLEPEMDLRAERYDSFDLLVELADIEGLEPAAIRDDLEFTAKYSGDVGRMAVVTDDPLWEQLSKFVGKPLGEVLGIDVEQFDQRSVAWEWLRAS